MKKILIGLLMGMVLGAGVIGGVWFPERALAIDTDLCGDEAFKDKQPDLWEAAGCREGDDRNETIFSLIEAGIRIVLTIIGILGVGGIIYGGVVYTLSTGDAAKVAKAKNIIIYGIVGLVVALLAFAIVEFVSKSTA